MDLSRSSRWRNIAVVVFAACLTALAGCSSQTQSLEREQSSLRPLSVLYGQYIGQHRGQPPANEAAFKQFLAALPKEQLATFGVNDPDKLFTSSRDGMPYVVTYGPAAGGAPIGIESVTIYEQKGRGGRRFVAFQTGKIEEVDEARFKELVPARP